MPAFDELKSVVSSLVPTGLRAGLGLRTYAAVFSCRLAPALCVVPGGGHLYSVRRNQVFGEQGSLIINYKRTFRGVVENPRNPPEVLQGSCPFVWFWFEYEPRTVLFFFTSLCCVVNILVDPTHAN